MKIFNTIYINFMFGRSKLSSIQQWKSNIRAYKSKNNNNKKINKNMRNKIPTQQTSEQRQKLFSFDFNINFIVLKTLTNIFPWLKWNNKFEDGYIIY
jgi:hypothetical protein